MKLILLIGQYAQQYYLDLDKPTTLTERVKNYPDYLPHYFVLPHPSPRNNIWQAKNPWFTQEVIPALQEKVHALIQKLVIKDVVLYVEKKKKELNKLTENTIA